MATLKLDDLGRPVPQHYSPTVLDYEIADGKDGALYILLKEAIPAGDNNIGNVDVASLPAIPAGDNNIGNVDVVSLPALPTGANTIGKVEIVPVGNTAYKATLVAATPLTIKAAAGIVYKIATSLSDVVLLDDSTEKWAGLGNEDFEGGIACATSIVLSSATGGTAYILYK